MILVVKKSLYFKNKNIILKFSHFAYSWSPSLLMFLTCGMPKQTQAEFKLEIRHRPPVFEFALRNQCSALRKFNKKSIKHYYLVKLIENY